MRDLIQVGQGLPTGRTVQVPNGAGALLIQRPHPQGSACTAWPAGTTAISAVTAGPGCGPVIDGVATDMVTTLAVDSALDAVPVCSFNVAGHTATVALPAQAADGLDISNGGPDDVRVGDLMMFTKGSTSALVYVTSVSGGADVHLRRRRPDEPQPVRRGAERHGGRPRDDGAHDRQLARTCRGSG